MPKRARTSDDGQANAATGKSAKVINFAYGEHNKAGIAIPCDPIPRQKLAKRGFTVVAWNLNGIRSFVEKRGELLKELWDREHVDILGITEHKVTDKDRADEVEKCVRKILEAHHVEFIWNMCSVKKGYSGSLAIVRRDIFQRIEKTSFGFGKSDPEGRMITLEFKETAVVIAYVPNSGMKLERLDYRVKTWDKDFSKFCRNLSETKSVLIAGDLNVAHRDVDIWNLDAPHIPKMAGTTPQERESFEAEFLSRGFVDTFAFMHADKKGWFSYWSVKAGNKPKNRGLRLDYVLADKKIKILDAFIAADLCKDGDHCPVGVVADLSV